MAGTPVQRLVQSSRERGWWPGTLQDRLWWRWKEADRSWVSLEGGDHRIFSAK